MKQIRITPREREELQKRFNVGANYVQQVLAYSKNGPKAETIRREAIRLGGRYVDPDFVPNCRTQYIGGMILQFFPEQVMLKINKETGDVVLEQKGVEIERVENARMWMWNSMAMKAQELSENAMVAPQN